MAVGNETIGFKVSKIPGPDDTEIKRTKEIEIQEGQDIYTVNLLDHFQIEGNGFYVDKTVNYFDPDYNEKPIRIVDLESTLF